MNLERANRQKRFGVYKSKILRYFIKHLLFCFWMFSPSGLYRCGHPRIPAWLVFNSFFSQAGLRKLVALIPPKHWGKISPNNPPLFPLCPSVSLLKERSK
jgi:hypothetical protein